MKNKPIQYGLFLAGATLALFFIVYFFYIGFNYYNISIKVNAFVLPSAYTLTAVILLHNLSKTEKLNFKNSFKYSFTAMFIGGTLSFLTIVLFLNYVDKSAQTLLQHQRIEINLQSIHDEYKTIKEPTEEEKKSYQELINGMNSETIKNDFPFTLKKSFAILGVLYSFYLVISLFLSLFFRSRNTNATFNRNPPAQ